MQTKLVLTLLGIILAALVAVWRRNKESQNSPKKFDIIFYIKDNWLTHLLSALISMTLVLCYNYLKLDVLIATQVANAESFEMIELFSSFMCGFAPHMALAVIDTISKVFSPKSIIHQDKFYKRKK